MPELKNFKVINTPLVESLARQLNLPIDQERKSEAQFGTGGKVSAGFKKSTSQSPLPTNDPRLLPPIIEALRDNGQLRVYRPEKPEEFWADPVDWYVHETAIATPVFVPVRQTLKSSEFLPEFLKVWIIDPGEPTREPDDEYDWIGSFVFIVEDLSDFPWMMPWQLSGISALRMIAEVVAVAEPITFGELQTLRTKDDLYGRWHDGHPIEKLEQVGGVSGRPRKIETIYKIGYMNNEQSGSINGQPRRMNDILAYPLFIAE